MKKEYEINRIKTFKGEQKSKPSAQIFLDLRKCVYIFLRQEFTGSTQGLNKRSLVDNVVAVVRERGLLSSNML